MTRIKTINRFPVKSMQGETVGECEVTTSGIAGDRAYALVDTQTGKVASAKNPKLWPGLLDWAARYDGEQVEISTPDGKTIRSDDPDADDRISDAIGRRVALVQAVPRGTLVDQYHPDIEDVNPEGNYDAVTQFPVGAANPGTFVDVFALHLLTTSTLAHFGSLSPGSRFDIARFRPSFLIETDEDGFVENSWVGRTIRVGDLGVTVPGATLRCVMTTLQQGDLPKDNDILRTAVRHNMLETLGLGRYPCVGVYGVPNGSATVRVGDPVTP